MYRRFDRWFHQATRAQRIGAALFIAVLVRLACCVDYAALTLSLRPMQKELRVEIFLLPIAALFLWFGQRRV